MRAAPGRRVAGWQGPSLSRRFSLNGSWGAVMIRRTVSVRVGLPLGLALILCWATPPALGDTAVLTADRDTMIVEEDVSFSNGAGNHFCVGGNASPSFRRSLLRFNLSPIPSGSMIGAVTLDLYQNNAASNAAGAFDLHRVINEWGEGTSQAPSGECQGAPGTLNDATYFYRLYNPGGGSIQWNNFGGDFVGSASASLVLSTASGHRLWSSAQMVTDVQSWLDGTETNDGWLLKRSSETGGQTAVRFASRTNPSVSDRPALIVTYTPPVAEGACCFPGQSCQVLLAADCGLQGGNFQGNGTDCSPNPCPPDPTGACCFNGSKCSVAIVSAQTRSAPDDPDKPAGVLSSRPNHTTASRLWPNPANQLSRNSSVVPVLPAIATPPNNLLAARPVPSRMTDCNALTNMNVASGLTDCTRSRP